MESVDVIYANYYDPPVLNSLGNEIEILNNIPDENVASLEYVDLDEISCPLCNQIFNSKGDKYEHIRDAHQNVRSYECSVCGRCFRKKGDATRHQLTHQTSPVSPPKPENDKSPEMKSIARLQGDIEKMAEFCRTVLNSPLENENICIPERPKRRNTLNTAGLSPAACKLLFYVLSNNITICPVCNKIYASKYSLKEHIRFVHNNIRNHACYICAKRFFKKCDVDRHLLIHEKNDRHLLIHEKKSHSSLPSTSPVSDISLVDVDAINTDIHKEVPQFRGNENEVNDSVVEMMPGAVMFCDVQLSDKNLENKLLNAFAPLNCSKIISNHNFETTHFENNNEIIVIENSKEPQYISFGPLDKLNLEASNESELNLFNKPDVKLLDDDSQKSNNIWLPLKLCQENTEPIVIQKPSTLRLCVPSDSNLNKCHKCDLFFTNQELLVSHSCNLIPKDSYEGILILECEEGPIFDRLDASCF